MTIFALYYALDQASLGSGLRERMAWLEVSIAKASTFSCFCKLKPTKAMSEYTLLAISTARISLINILKWLLVKSVVIRPFNFQPINAKPAIRISRAF